MFKTRLKRHFPAFDRGQAYQRVHGWFETAVASFLLEKDLNCFYSLVFQYLFNY